VVYFFRTGSKQEQMACLEVAFKFDVIRERHLAANLLAWHGDLVLPEFSGKNLRRLLQHLESILFSKKTSAAVAEQIVEVVAKVRMNALVEAALVGWLWKLGDSPGQGRVMASSHIADLLQETNSPVQTDRLINLASDCRKDGYVRRYATEALNGRKISRAKKSELFLRLIKDPDADVRCWVKGWYFELEDSALQAAMFDILQSNSSSSICQDVAMPLGNSKLRDTGPKLFQWLMAGPQINQEAVGWVCRALAELNYRPAIAEFIRRLQGQPDPRMGEQLLICLGKMRAKSALPQLVLLLERSNVDSFWWADTIYQILGNQDRAIAKTLTGHGQFASYVSLLARAMTGASSAEASIVKFLFDVGKPLDRRSMLLSKWGYAMMGYSRPGHVYVGIPKPRAISKRFRNALYRLLSEHNDLSPRSLLLLIEFELDVSRLTNGLIDNVPRFRSPLDGRELPHSSARPLDRLAQTTRPWLNRQLASPDIPLTFVRSCAVLAELLGDQGTWEAIQSNVARVRLAIGAGAVIT
jgi:hypothetical protein